MTSPIVARVTSLVHDFDARVQAAPSDRWSKPAPCDGWTAIDVVAHVAGNCSWLTAGLSKAAPLAFDPENPVASWDTLRDAFLAALTTSDLSLPIAGPSGNEMPAEQMIGRFVASDILIHTWDLARAVGGDERLDPAAVTAAFSGLKMVGDMMRRPGAFGPAVASSPDDDEQTQFLKFAGRAV